MIIGLSGFSRCGKDTIANYLVEHHGFTRIAFADAIRDAVYNLNPLVPYWDGHYPVAVVVDKVGWDEAKATPEVRRLLQVFGTEVGRGMWPNIWKDIAAKKVEACSGPVVVTDIRYIDELEWLHGWSWNISVHVTRPGVGPVNGHASDKGIDEKLFDRQIRNDGSLDELYSKLNTMFGLPLERH